MLTNISINFKRTFWILRKRKTVKNGDTYPKVSFVKKYSTKSADTQFASFPKDRIMCVADFQVTGIDLADLYIWKKEVKLGLFYLHVQYAELYIWNW